jgi:hypothetical protein
MPQVKNNVNFLNLTDLDDKEAKEIVHKVRERVIQAESDRRPTVARAESSLRLWRNEFWSDEDVKYFEDKFNVSPYQIPAARAPLNRLVAQQRGARYEFGITPIDQMSYERQRKGREKYIQEHGEEFETEEQAGDYFDRYYDDEFAQAVEIYYDNIRIKGKTKYVESQCFENMLITGLDFLKSTYTRQNNPDGEIKTERRSVRQMLWDHGSVSPTLEDIEYIGEVHRLYLQDLIALYPEYVEEIGESFDNYTNFMRGPQATILSQSWQHFYDFDTERGDVRAKVVEFWYQDTEQRFQLVHNDTGDRRLIKYGLEEEEIWDFVKEIELDNVSDLLQSGELEAEFFNRPEAEVREDIDSFVKEKYSIAPTSAKVWYKVMMGHDALLEFKRDPLPHHSHPYTPAFAQFTEGWYTGIVDDVKDILLAYNKAFMFREIMLANGAKGVLLIDRGAVNKSGYTIDDIRDMWTEVGGVIDLELRGGRRLSDVFQNVTTIADGLSEIRVILNDLERKLYDIMGVNSAMLGNVGNEAPASQVRQRIQQGQAVNGVMFDNFNKALEIHAHEKVIPLVVAEMMSKKPSALKGLSENRSKWIELNYDEEFDLFSNAILNGEYQTRLTTREPDQQLESQQSAMLLQLAQSRPDAIDLEAAIEFSNIPFSGKFLRRNKELMRQRQREQQMRMVDLQQVAQMMAEYGIDSETAEKMLQNLRKGRVAELRGSQGGGNQTNQGNAEIQRESAEMTRQSDIEQQLLT